MCTATLGATPVKSCTCAAPSIFSCGVRGTPCWAKTLNRVPEFPYAHEGVSICWRRRASFTALVSFTLASLLSVTWSVQVEDLGERPHPLVGAAVEVLEKRRHLRLPPRVHLGAGHRL